MSTINAATTTPAPAMGTRDSPPDDAAGRASLGLAAVAVFAVAMNLRLAIASVSPLVGTIRTGLGLSSVGVSLMTTIPTLAMGVGAPVAAVIGRRWGLHRGVLVGLVVIGVGTAARAGGQITWLQFASAAVAGLGIALAQTLLPAIVKARFADHIGLMTGIYTAGLGLSAVIAAGVSVQLANAFGAWPLALASWAVLAVAGIALWSACGRSLGLGSASAPVGPVTRGLPWRSRTAWRITLVSAGNSALYYCELAWLAPLLHDDGHLSQSSAGDLLTIMLCVQVACMLVIPAALGERRDRRIGLVITGLMTALGFLGFAFSAASGTWVWLLLMGIGHGGFFPLVLALPAASGGQPAQVRQISGMAFFVGYGAAAAAPLIVGWLREASGSFQLAFALLGAAAVATVVPILRLSGNLADDR